MYDTIGVRFPVRIDPEVWRNWDEKSHKKAKGGGYYLRILPVMSNSGAPIQYSYYPYADQGNSFLNVEFSLPHLILGSNVYMIFNINSAIDLANEMLPELPGVPKLDLWNGIISRLDVCYNHQVGNLVPYYVRALQFLDYPKRKAWPYKECGVQFPTHDKTFKLYNKQQERLDRRDPVGAQLAHGILRQETTFRKKAVRKLTGLKKPTLGDINNDMLPDALASELQELNLLGRSIATRKTALERLSAVYGSRAGIYYFGLLVSKMEQPSKESIRSATGLHPKSLDRQLEKIVQADVPLTLIDTDEPLPPLNIDREMVMSMANEDVLVSVNTR